MRTVRLTRRAALLPRGEEADQEHRLKRLPVQSLRTPHHPEQLASRVLVVPKHVTSRMTHDARNHTAAVEKKIVRLLAPGMSRRPEWRRPPTESHTTAAGMHVPYTSFQEAPLLTSAMPVVCCPSLQRCHEQGPGGRAQGVIPGT